jgi:hypothetical protein
MAVGPGPEPGLTPVRNGHDQTQRLFLRKARVCLDFTDLQNVSLLVRGNHQRPLVGVASLSLYEVSPQVVTGGPDVLPKTVVVHAVSLERLAQVARLSRGPFRRDGLLSPRAIDAVPEHVRIGHRAGSIARRLLESRLQILPIDRSHDNEMFDNLSDRPRVGRTTELDLSGSQARDLIKEPPGRHVQVCGETVAVAFGHRPRAR